MAALSSPVVVFLSFFLSLLSLKLANGASLFTNCPTSVCLSQSVSYECRVDTTGGAGSLNWRVLDTNNDPIAGVITYNKGQALQMSIIDNDFTANLTNSSGPIVSDVTFTPILSFSNYTVECIASGISFTQVSDACTILIADIPAAPVPNDLNFTSDTLIFSWSPSTSTCLSHYNVNVTSIEYTINTTDTSLSLPVRSTNDTEYSISVVAVGTGGRYIDQEGKRFIPDAPPPLMNFLLSQTYPDDDDDTVNITVSWNEPPSSSRPDIPVSSYIIYHNVTDPDTSITVPAPTTTYNIPDATVGSIYTVGVAAVNVLGTGDNTSAIISILSTVVPTSLSMMVSSSILTVTPSLSDSSSSSTGPTVTPSISSAPTDNTTGGSDNTVYIGIGAGAALIVIGIILIIVGCLIWRKPWKGEKEDTTTNTVIYDTPTDTVQVPNVPVSMNTAYGTATANKGVVHATDNVAYGHVNTTSNTGARPTDTAVYEAVQ